MFSQEKIIIANPVDSDHLSNEICYKAFGSMERPNDINGAGKAIGRKAYQVWGWVAGELLSPLLFLEKQKSLELGNVKLVFHPPGPVIKSING